MEYGVEIYSSATEARLHTLDSVHHTGIRLGTGEFHSSPIISLMVDAGVLPLDLRHQTPVRRYWYRIHRLPKSVTYITISRDANTII